MSVVSSFYAWLEAQSPGYNPSRPPGPLESLEVWLGLSLSEGFQDLFELEGS